MIYVILNVLVLLFFVYYTYLLDRNVKGEAYEVSSFAVSVLFILVESAAFILTLLFKNIWYESLTTQLMRIAFCFDGVFLVSISLGFIKIGLGKKKNFLRFINFLLIVAIIYIVFWRFTNIDVSFENGIVIASEYLFKGPAREYFPWTWQTLYNALFRFIIPAFCYVCLIVLQEEKATQLEKYQTLIIGEGLVLMWLTSFVITFISDYNPSFSLLFMFSFLFLIVVIFNALTKSSVPSGKGIFVNILKFFVSYLIPAVGVGAAAMFLQPKGTFLSPDFLVPFIAIAIGVIYLALMLSQVFSSSTKIYTADYERALEKDLASVDYSNAEMDDITAKMNDIFRRNVEASSMNVYILNSQNELETAYSSNNMNMKFSVNNPIFDTLLNVNKSVVIWSEIEKSHDVSSIQDELAEFFDKSKSDALFILNEGHNIFGLITFGKKISGDHYKEYDYNVFVKLYSYFFVFGYFMRNISNKEIISVVNREIKMSSQIITSIQENIDHLKTNKVDTGYLMVPAHNIGGEFIDMIRLTENRHLFVVGDMSGKGIAASMNMVILKSIIRTYLSETHDFKQLVVKINSFIRDSLRKGTIFAGLFALIDFETDTMYYINCGVPALMMYTQVYNNVIEIQGSGHILGFVKDISPFLSVKTTKLNRGDIILACTDGMIQSHSLRGEQFGKERVQQALLDNSTYPAQRMAQFTFDGLLKFMSKEMEDDVSILVLKYETSVEYNQDTETPAAEPPIEGSIDIPSDATPPDSPEEEPVVEESVVEETVVEETPAEEPVVEETPEFDISAYENNDIVVEETPSFDEPVAEETPSFDEPAAPEAPAEEPAPAAESPVFDDPDLPEGMPDLSDLDAMMKEAGL